jgi:site-specific recombinase XerD
MTATLQLSANPLDQLRATALAPFAGIYEGYLSDHGYAPSTQGGYLRCLAHFGRWMSQCGLDAEDLDEEVVAQLLDGHLPHCRCPAAVGHTREDLRAALGHLLVVLRANAVIPERVSATTPVDQELCRFDVHMDKVCGLAATTRSFYRYIIRCFLVQQFGDDHVDLAAMKPEAVRRFVTDQSTHYSSPGGTAAVISALRRYFRFRTACGDQVQALIAVLTSPPNWRQASLPKALSSTEVQRLVDSLGWEGPSARRADAMVRLALDLGLRRGEIAGLALDDIDWRAGTIRLRRTKGGREDTLPLPETTGRAIADYLRLERPQTTSRGVFVRRIAPCGRPVGPHCVGKTIRQAYARAGLPYTGAHLLRHTMASRLLASGSSLKEVADVLRHRSLNTTLIYAKLDTRSLSTVALPWPGDSK